MSYKKISLSPINVINALKDFLIRNKNSELEIAMKKPERADVALSLIRNTLLNETYMEDVELVTEPFKLDRHIEVLTYDNTFPLTDPAKQVMENISTQLRQIQSYNSLIELQCIKVNRIKKAYERELVEIQKHIDNDDMQEAEIIATPVVENMKRAIGAIKSPRDIISKIGVIKGFNNTRIIANPDGQYPTSVSIKDKMRNPSTVRPLTKEEIHDLASVAVHILEKVKSFDRELVLQLEKTNKDTNDTLGALLDTGLSDDVDLILEQLDIEPLFNAFLLPIEKTDIFDISRAIVQWIEYSIKK